MDASRGRRRMFPTTTEEGNIKDKRPIDKEVKSQ